MKKSLNKDREKREGKLRQEQARVITECMDVKRQKEHKATLLASPRKIVLTPKKAIMEKRARISQKEKTSIATNTTGATTTAATSSISNAVPVFVGKPAPAAALHLSKKEKENEVPFPPPPSHPTPRMEKTPSLSPIHPNDNLQLVESENEVEGVRFVNASA
jgi:hypothetical protein